MRAAREPDATPDLNFTEGAHQSATHMLHPYAARCPPPLARWAISNYSTEGEVVLDPMTGSGTTLVEACLLGRTALGADIDPLARLIARVKATPVAPAEIRRAASRLAAALDDDRLDDGWRPDLPQFDKWFTPEVARDLGAIRVAIKRLRTKNRAVTELLWVAFSSLIVARTSVANARDLVHSRHHHRPWTTNPQTRSRFLKKIEQFHRRMTEYHELLRRGGHLDVQVRVDDGDARELGLSNGAVDLVFTSPPYCSALDYTRAHMFAVAWMPEILGIDEEEYGDNQKWKLVSAGPGLFRIQGKQSGLYLTVSQLSSANSPLVIQAGPSSGPGPAGQNWITTPWQPGQLVTAASQLVADVTGNSHAKLTPIELYTANNGANQQFMLLPVQDDPTSGDEQVYVVLIANQQGMVFDISATNGLVQNLWSSGAPSQRWSRVDLSGTAGGRPLFMLESVAEPGMFITVQGDGTKPGQLLVIAARDDQPHQQWTLAPPQAADQ